MSATVRQDLTLDVGSEIGSVSALLTRPSDAAALLVLAHGAGAGMRHRFMEGIAEALAERGVATLRYQFPYAESGRRRPDRAPILVATVRSAAAAALGVAPDLPVMAGGKSMGGRMTSIAHAEAPLPGVRGIVFLGFPLHRPGDPSDRRADHLFHVNIPMLFVQGTRDRLARVDRLRAIVLRLDGRASLHVVEDGDHGFDVLKRTGRSTSEVYMDMAGAVRAWIETVLRRTE
jgi:predicted alpha/beta-hydrolase family hydrolase